MYPTFDNKESHIIQVTIPSDAELDHLLDLNDGDLEDTLFELIWEASLNDVLNAARGSREAFEEEDIYLFDASKYTIEDVYNWLLWVPRIRQLTKELSHD